MLIGESRRGPAEIALAALSNLIVARLILRWWDQPAAKFCPQNPCRVGQSRSAECVVSARRTAALSGGKSSLIVPHTVLRSIRSYACRSQLPVARISCQG